MASRTLLKVRDAAQRAGVSLGLIYAWIKGGLIAHYRVGTPGTRGTIRIADVDLDSFLDTLKKDRQAAKPAYVPPKAHPMKLSHLTLPS